MIIIYSYFSYHFSSPYLPHTHTHTHTRTHTHIYIYIYIHTHTHTHTHTHYVLHMKPLNSCFDLIRSHQQCIQWSPSLEFEPVTTECRAENLSLSHWSTSLTSHPKLTSHGKCATTLPHVSCSYIHRPRTQSFPELCLQKLEIHICIIITSWARK